MMHRCKAVSSTAGYHDSNVSNIMTIAVHTHCQHFCKQSDQGAVVQ